MIMPDNGQNVKWKTYRYSLFQNVRLVRSFIKGPNVDKHLSYLRDENVLFTAYNTRYKIVITNGLNIVGSTKLSTKLLSKLLTFILSAIKKN